MGAEVAAANMGNPDEVSTALAGTSSAFLLNPPSVAGDSFARAEEIGVSLASAVRRAAVPKAAVLSSIGAQHASGTGVIATLHLFEAVLAEVAPATVLLRSGYFVETWAQVADTVVANGVLPTFLEPYRKIPMVSTIDVGRAAAQLLCENWAGQRIVELGGSQDWSARDVAQAFAEVLDNSVTPVFVPPEQRAAILTATGLPKSVVTVLLGMYEGIANGFFDHQDGTERLRGKVPLETAIERIVGKRTP